jgi:hypothetical protein
LCRGSPLEEAALVRDRAGERALLVPEQLRLEQVLRERAAVDRDERMMLPVAVEMQTARDELLPVPLSPWINTVLSVSATC